jgi:type IV pilus assembly protein PilB
MVSRLKVMAQLDISERRLPQDGRFRIRTRGREVDFRISSLPTVYGEKIVMRVLDKSAQQMDIDRLGFDALGLERFSHALDSPHGMLLVTGPTGSGKTTTLYAALHRINTPQVNIVTVEDPVEYQFPGVNQVQVNADIDLTFAAGLRSILRQDPDVVMVGEVRDFETADIAVKAALTGHLVLTTLHTNDAASAFTRIVDMGVEPYLGSTAINLVVAQRLVRRLCERCKQPTDVDAAVLKRAQYRGPTNGEEENFHQPVGCPYCRQTGYSGRLALLEVLPVTDELRKLMLSNADAHQIKQQALTQDMETLRQSGLRRAMEGITSLQEVLRVTAAD